MAVNTEFYINECLQPRLLPFMHKHHMDFNFQFVHDFAGAHFSIGTIALMKENLPFGNNTTNPPNQSLMGGVNTKLRAIADRGGLAS